MNKASFTKITYGLYIVNSLQGERFNGQIANTVFQVTSEPPTLGISINKLNLTHDFIRESRLFSASVLAESTPMEFIGRFGFKCGRDINKFEGIRYRLGGTGVPIVLDHCIAYLEAEVIGELDCGSHTFFLGQVKECDILSDKPPMTYAYYHAVKGGKSPANAPTYQPEEHKTKFKEEKMTKYVCSICGYVYDPAIGDPDSGIKPGTKFEDLPDNWVCPICGADKTNFSPE